MANEKVYSPETIADNPFPQREEASFGAPKTGTIKDKPLPVQKTATRLINSILNTTAKKILGEFQFTNSGAIKIGKYVSGSSGEVAISPDGIVATNLTGETSFAIDAETGNATFKGQVLAGSVVSGEVEVGGVDNESGRILVNDASGNLIILADSLGHHYYDTDEVELIKMDWVGFHAYDVSGNELVTVDVEGFHGYKADGTKQIKISDDGIEGYGTLGNTFNFYDEEGGTLFGQMGYFVTGNYFYIYSEDAAIKVLADGQELLLSSAGANVTLSATGGNRVLIGSAGADAEIVIDSYDGSGGDSISLDTSDLKISGTSGHSGYVYLDVGQTKYILFEKGLAVGAISF